MVLIPSTNIIVDGFRYSSTLPSSTFVFFLTHMHADHYCGLSSNWDKGPIYCSSVSALMLRDKYPGLKNIHIIDTEETEYISGVTVKAIPANHCPGSLMFLFETSVGNVLHTGDFRVYPEVYTYLLDSTEDLIKIHHLYLDNTFCSRKFKFPSRDEAKGELLKLIQSDEYSEVWLEMTHFGKEDLLVELAERFSTKIVADEDFVRTIRVIGMNEQLFTTSEDEGWIKLVNKEMSKSLNQEIREKGPILHVKLSGWAKIFKKKADYRYSIPYSNHSSYPELQEFVSTLKPNKITFLCPYTHQLDGNFEIIEKASGEARSIEISQALRRKPNLSANLVKAKRPKLLGSRLK